MSPSSIVMLVTFLESGSGTESVFSGMCTSRLLQRTVNLLVAVPARD